MDRQGSDGILWARCDECDADSRGKVEIGHQHGIIQGATERNVATPYCVCICAFCLRACGMPDFAMPGARSGYQ